MHNRPNILPDTNGLPRNFSGQTGLLLIDADIGRVSVLPGHTPEGILNNHRGISAHPKLQEHHPQSLMAAEEILVPLPGCVPARILHKGIVTPQVHGHGTAADGTAGHQFRRHPHLPLLRCHLPDCLLVVIGLVMTGLDALPQAIVPLGIEQPLFIKPRALKLMVHIGSQNKVVHVPDQCQQLPIDRLRRLHIPVPVDLPAPPGPVLLQRGKRIKPAGIQIRDMVFCNEVAEESLEPLPGIGQSGRCGQAGARPDHNCVRLIKRRFQLAQLPLPAGFGRCLRQDP